MTLQRTTHHTAAAKLPFEVQCMIAQALGRPSDLYRLSLVCRTWYDAAIQSLYCHLRFRIGNQDDVQLASTTLNIRNRGLKHVKSVHLSLIPAGFRSQADTTIRALLAAIPEDALHSFHWDDWAELTQPTLRLLLTRQKKMKVVQAFHVQNLCRSASSVHNIKDHDLIFPRTPGQGLRALDRCEELTLSIQSWESSEISRILLSKSRPLALTLRVRRNVQKLRFMVGADEVIPPVTTAYLNEFPRKFVERLCSNSAKASPTTSMNRLKSLTLFNAEFSNCFDTWDRFVPFANLRTLRLRSCRGLSQFLVGYRALGSTTLRHLEIQVGGRSKDSTLTAIESYLTYTTGLEEIVLSLTGMTRMLDRRSITTHGRSLRLLSVHVSMSDDDMVGLQWPHTDFQHITTACTKLEQLSCDLPPTVVIAEPTDEWIECIAAILSLPALHTLRIGSWPEVPDGIDDLYLDAYNCALQSIAKSIFNPDIDLHGKKIPSERSNLRLIAFGCSDQSLYASTEKYRLYKRGPPSGPHQRLQAVEITAAERIYDMPESDIMEKWVAFAKGIPGEMVEM
ncbi:Hypothetical protein D9617_4g003140 [Elsinoe fawcettii]|nr:Hypothetical protein D9617_4g003140 [Elsinoe fawcettii]